MKGLLIITYMPARKLPKVWVEAKPIAAPVSAERPTNHSTPMLKILRITIMPTAAMINLEMNLKMFSTCTSSPTLLLYLFIVLLTRPSTIISTAINIAVEIIKMIFSNVRMPPNRSSSAIFHSLECLREENNVSKLNDDVT